MYYSMQRFINILLSLIIVSFLSFIGGMKYEESTGEGRAAEVEAQSTTSNTGENVTKEEATDELATDELAVDELATDEPATKEIATNEDSESPTPNNGRISSPSEFKYHRNAVDGISLTWVSVNNTGKRINYYTANISTYNPVGDPSYDENSGKSTFRINYVGPIEDGEELLIFDRFTYQGALEKITIDSLTLKYDDGTEETIEYDLSTEDASGLQPE